MARKNRSRSRKKKSSILWPLVSGAILLVAGVGLLAWRSTEGSAVTPSGKVGVQVGDTAQDFSAPTQAVAQDYPVRSLDTTLILGENGVVVYKDEFPTPYKTLKKVLREVGL